MENHHPGLQGYVIQMAGSGDNLKLTLVGSDSLGTLYAAVTCRQLIVKRDGQLLLQPVFVRDWPDFKTRCNGAPDLRRTGPTRTNAGGEPSPFPRRDALFPPADDGSVH